MARKSNFSSKNPFEDDDDAMTSEFLSSSSTSYLAADRLPQNSEDRALREAEQRRQDLLQQMKQIETRTLQSSNRSVQMLVESEDIGIETAQDLSKQREQLQNTEKRLDDINSTLKTTQKNIDGIKSVFSSLRQWWATPKHPPSDKDAAKDLKSPKLPEKPTEPVMSRHLEDAVNKSQSAVTSFRSNGIHPGLKVKGFDDDDDDDLDAVPSTLQEFHMQSQLVNQKLDEDLDVMAGSLSRLKGLATNLGKEITDQNDMLDRIGSKADRADITIQSQNTQVKRILKR